MRHIYILTTLYVSSLIRSTEIKEYMYTRAIAMCLRCLFSLKLVSVRKYFHNISIDFQITQSSDLMQPLLSSALRVLLHCLGLNQSTIVLQHMFSSQRSLVSKVNQFLSLWLITLFFSESKNVLF